MIAMCWVAFAITAVLAAWAWGALQMSLQPSAQRLVLTAIVALLAPLFWPGAATTLLRTGARIASWSLVVTCLALLMLRIAGGGRQPFTHLASVGAMLILILLATHALAAGIEVRLRGLYGDAGNARESAGRTATTTLALAAAVPLWLGPAAELLARDHPWVADAVVGVSPLTHLAVASGNDLLRNEWLYDHSNLSRLAVSYPSLASILVTYGSIVLALALVALARRSPWRRFGGAGTTRTTMEDVTS